MQMLTCLQGEQVALFEIKGDHTGYEDKLDLPTDFTFQGARVPLPGLLQAAVKGALSAINLFVIPIAETVLLVSKEIGKGQGQLRCGNSMQCTPTHAVSDVRT
jgi:hypothetical protein